MLIASAPFVGKKYRVKSKKELESLYGAVDESGVLGGVPFVMNRYMLALCGQEVTIEACSDYVLTNYSFSKKVRPEIQNAILNQHIYSISLREASWEWNLLMLEDIIDDPALQMRRNKLC